MAQPTKPATKRKTARDWATRFLSALSRTGNISTACKAAGIDRSTAYARRDRDPSFAGAMADALEQAADALELEARRRAQDGVRRVKFHKGEPIMVPALDRRGMPIQSPDGQPVLVPYVEHEYSDVLLIFLLKGLRPEKYRDPKPALPAPLIDPVQARALLQGMVHDAGQPVPALNAGPADGAGLAVPAAPAGPGAGVSPAADGPDVQPSDCGDAGAAR